MAPHPREAWANRLERRVRSIVRDELDARGYVERAVDNPVDNPVLIERIRGGHRGGLSTVVESGDITPDVDIPRIRNRSDRRRGQLDPHRPITEAELWRGHGLSIDDEDGEP